MNQTPVIGLDIGGSWIRIALGTEQQIINQQAFRWPYNLSSLDEVDFIAQNIQKLMGETSVDVRAIGVSLAALTDKTGTVISWPNRPKWQSLPVKSLLQDRFAIPVVIEDDANMAALAEFVFGVGQGCSHMLFVIAGTGIGSGIIIDGNLFRGRNGWAGELGHQMVQMDGPRCSCGNHGCVQMLASGRMIDQVAIAHGLQCAADVALAAEQGQSWAIETLSQAGRWLGIAIANVVNLLDLETIVIGGGLHKLADPWWSTLVKTVEVNLLNKTHRHVSIQRAALSNEAGLLGAIYCAQKEIYSLVTSERSNK